MRWTEAKARIDKLNKLRGVFEARRLKAHKQRLLAECERLLRAEIRIDNLTTQILTSVKWTNAAKTLKG